MTKSRNFNAIFTLVGEEHLQRNNNNNNKGVLISNDTIKAC